MTTSSLTSTLCGVEANLAMAAPLFVFDEDLSIVGWNEGAEVDRHLDLVMIGEQLAPLGTYTTIHLPQWLRAPLMLAPQQHPVAV